MIEIVFAVAVVVALILVFTVMRGRAVKSRHKRKPDPTSDSREGGYVYGGYDGGRKKSAFETAENGSSDSGGDGGGGGD